MTNYPKGSAGAAEQKEYKTAFIVMGIITVGLLLLQFVIPGLYRNEVKASPTWMNVLGGIITAGSFIPMYLASRSKNEEGASGYAIATAVLIVIGFFLCAGFFGYTYKNI